MGSSWDSFDRFGVYRSFWARECLKREQSKGPGSAGALMPAQPFLLELSLIQGKKKARRQPGRTLRVLGCCPGVDDGGNLRAPTVHLIRHTFADRES